MEDYTVLDETYVKYKLQDLTGVGSRGYGVAISPDKQVIITASDNAPYFTIQKLNSESEVDIYEKLQDLTGVSNTGSAVTISPDKQVIVTVSGNAPYYTIQKLNSETGLYEKLQNLTEVSTNGNAVTISPDKQSIVTASFSDPSFTVCSLGEEKKVVEFNTPPVLDDIVTADYTVPYIPKSSDYILDVIFTLNFGEVE